MFDPNTIKVIIAVIMIILDIFVLGIGVVYILFGMLFGTRKSLRRALSFLIPFIIFVLSINLFTNILLNTTIPNFFSDIIEGDKITLQEMGVSLLANVLSEYLYNGNIVAAESSEIITLSIALCKTILKLVIYFIGLFTIAFIIAPFIRFITWLSFRIQIKGKPKQKMLWASRIGGMGIASIRYIVFLFVVILPISGGFSTVKMLVEDATIVVDVLEENEQNLDGELNFAKSILSNVDEGMEYSLSRKFFKLTRGKNNEASIDMRYLGSFLNVKTENGTLNLLEEYGLIHTIIPSAADLFESINLEEDIYVEDIINAVQEEDIDVLQHILKDSNLINIALPVGYDYLAFYLNEEGILEENNITNEMIESVDINNDFDHIVDALAIVLDIVVTEDIHFENEEELIEIIITNEKISNNLQTFISNILDTTTIQNIGLPLGSYYLVDLIENSDNESLEQLIPLISSEKLNLYLKNDISTVFLTVQELYSTPLKEIVNCAIRGEDLSSIYVDFSDPAITKAVENTIVKLMGLNLVHGNEDSIVKALMLMLLDEYDIDQILFDENGNPRIDWSNETNIVATTVVTLLEVFGEDLMANISDPTQLIICLLDSKNAEEIVKDVTKSTLAESLVITFLYDYLQNDLDIPESLKEVLTKEALETCFEEDIITLIHLIQDIYETSAKEEIISLIKGNELNLSAIDFSDETLTSKIKNAIVTLLNLTIIEENEEALLEYALNLISENNDSFNIDAKEVLYDKDGNKYIDWDLETTIISNILVDLLEMLGNTFGQELEVTDYIDIFVTNDNTEEVINQITSSQLLEKIVVSMISQIISSAEDVPLELKEIFSEENLKNAFNSDIKKLYQILVDIYESPLKEDILNTFINNETFNPDLSSLEVQATFKDTLRRLISLEIITGNEEKLIKMLMNNIEGIEINLDSVLYDENGNPYLNWDNEINALCDALIEVINVLGSDFSEFSLSLLQENLLSDEEKTKHFVNTISESEIVRTIILNIIPNIIHDSELLPEQLLSFFAKEKFDVLKDKELFKDEMTLLLDIVYDLLSLGITDFESFAITTENELLIKEVLTKLLDTTFIRGEEETLFKLFMDTTNFASLLEENGIVLDYESVTDWHNELVISIDIALGFVDIATGEDFALSDLFVGNMSDEEINNICNLFDKIGQSQLFKPIVYQLISNVGYDINITDEDKVLIENNGFGKEIKSLLEVIGEAQSLLEAEDLSTLKGSDVESLMIVASDGIITSKVVGKLLETALGSGGLNINPVDEYGKPKYDFSDPQTLKEQAKNIANLIDLANSMSSFDINNATSVTDITTALKGLEGNELAEDALEEITGIEVNLDNIDISGEATVIENVYEEYINSEDPDNFVPSDEALEQLENSPLAETILGILGIISK